MYKNYIFDLYGTLIDIHTDEDRIYLWKKLKYFYSFHGAKYSTQDLKKKFHDYMQNEHQNMKKLYPQYIYIDIQMENIFEKLYLEKGIIVNQDVIESTAQFFRIISTQYLQVYEGVFDMLSSLQKEGKKIYLLTNAQRFFTIPELKALDLYHVFDGIVISSDEHCCKPETSFYQILFDRYSLTKEESIMIGNDLTTDIKGAREFGIDSLYIHSNLSPQNYSQVNSLFSIMDGDVKKIISLLLKK